VTPRDRGRLVGGHAAEEAQVDEPREVGVDSLEGAERLSTATTRIGGRRGSKSPTAGRDARPPLVRHAPARLVDEDAPHHLRGDGEELRPVLPLGVVLAHESQ
jgi:hypothetical protein